MRQDRVTGMSMDIIACMLDIVKNKKLVWLLIKGQLNAILKENLNVLVIKYGTHYIRSHKKPLILNIHQ